MQQTLTSALVVGLGGFIGANARYFLSVWLTGRLGGMFPFATLIINVSGSFLLGIFLAWLDTRTQTVAPEVKLLFATGFCGAYTTFSTFATDTIGLAHGGHAGTALIYVLATNGLCLGAALLGALLGQRL